MRDAPIVIALAIDDVALADRLMVLLSAVAGIRLAAPDEPLDEVSPLLAGKTQINGTATAYVCHNHTCSAPLTAPEELRSLLVSQ